MALVAEKDYCRRLSERLHFIWDGLSMGFLKLPFTKARSHYWLSRSLALAALATCDAKRFFLIYRNISRKSDDHL